MPWANRAGVVVEVECVGVVNEGGVDADQADTGELVGAAEVDDVGIVRVDGERQVEVAQVERASLGVPTPADGVVWVEPSAEAGAVGGKDANRAVEEGVHHNPVLAEVLGHVEADKSESESGGGVVGIGAAGHRVALGKIQQRRRASLRS